MNQLQKALRAWLKSESRMREQNPNQTFRCHLLSFLTKEIPFRLPLLVRFFDNKIISLCHSILPILLLQMPKQTLIQSNAPTLGHELPLPLLLSAYGTTNSYVSSHDGLPFFGIHSSQSRMRCTYCSHRSVIRSVWLPQYNGFRKRPGSYALSYVQEALIYVIEASLLL